MALMPEDLLNKRFTPVRFSEGYDMDEVDNYLDNDVLPRLQELLDENARLTTELDEAQNRIAELETAAQNAPQASEQPDTEATAVTAAPETDVTGEQSVVADEASTGSTAAIVDDAPVTEEQATAPSEDTTSFAAADTAPAADQSAAQAVPGAGADQSAAGIIALANRLHDEYVKNGEDERDRLISEANDEHKRIVGEAEETSRTTLEALETKRAELEKVIEGLRTFERDYRNRLRNYLENQLRDLDTSDTQDKQANFGL